jgi:hypothetical protein
LKYLKLRDLLSNICPGSLFDRQEQKTKQGNDETMTIGKYEEEIAKHSGHIIGSDLKPFLDKIIDLTIWTTTENWRYGCNCLAV